MPQDKEFVKKIGPELTTLFTSRKLVCLNQLYFGTFSALAETTKHDNNKKTLPNMGVHVLVHKITNLKSVPLGAIFCFFIQVSCNSQTIKKQSRLHTTST